MGRRTNEYIAFAKETQKNADLFAKETQLQRAHPFFLKKCEANRFFKTTTSLIKKRPT